MGNPVYRRSAIAVAAVMLLTASASAQIRWKSGTSEGRDMTSAQAAQAMADLTLPGRDRHIVVQFSRGLTPAENEILTVSGVRLQNYITDNAFFATVGPEMLDVEKLSLLEPLRDAQAIDPVWKLHPTLLEEQPPAWATLPRKDVGGSIPAGRSADDGQSDQIITYIVFHPDVDLDTKGRAIVNRLGGSVLSSARFANLHVAVVDFDRIVKLAADDGVQFIQPALPALVETADGARALTGADIAQAAPYNLTGSGVSVMVWDTGLVFDQHTDFAGLVGIGFGEVPPPPYGAHATHVAGLITGTGAASAGQFRGIAPDTLIGSYKATFESGFIQGSLYLDPGDMENDYLEAIQFFLANIANNSITTDLAANNFPCAWEGDYSAVAAFIDDIQRGRLHPVGEHMTIVWSAGNERGNGACGTSFGTIPPPAGAKNVITVGAVNTNDDSLTAGTSFGPTDDGRIKPDLVGPGSQVGGDGGINSVSSTNPNGYAVMSGSSMATAAVSGVLSLMTKDYRDANPGVNPPPALLKAALIQTAADIDQPGPDFKSGWGSVRAVPAIDLVRSGQFLEASVIQDGVYLFEIDIAPSDSMLKVTVVWDDAPGSPNAAGTIVNDLDVRAIAPDASVHHSWLLDPENPANAATRTGGDRVNNVEQVVVDSPMAGTWVIEVRGHNVPLGSQSFHAVAQPNVTNCSSRGVVGLNQFFYDCGGFSPVIIRVVDCDLNANSGSAEIATATISTPHDLGSFPAAQQMVELTETGPDTSDFRGTILFTNQPNSTNRLYFEPGDIVTVTYNDADTGNGTPGVSTSTGEIDCEPPIVSNVQFSQVAADRFTVTFDTDEIARASVFAGTFCGAADFVEFGVQFGTSHALTITGLEDETTYFVAIFDIEDAAGNLAPIDDNGGLCYEVTTTPLPDSFTEFFTGGNAFDLANSRMLFTVVGGLDFYDACIEPISVFNSDPTGHAPITPALGDDNFTQIAITGGQSVHLYGQPHSSFFVNSNGNITFNAGFGDFTPTIAEHLSAPRIAALYSDLSPNLANSVETFAQLADRMVVTYQNVPQFGTTNSNNLQYELYFNGDIAISWLGIDLTGDKIVGLSPGTGLTDEFIEDNLSNAGTCGPRPPVAANSSDEVLINATTPLTLTGTDDGLPNGTLEYKIFTLPTHPIRDPANNQLITAQMLPYTLLNNGNAVNYTPTALGNDSFQFRLNDGGTPPDGGDSNLATKSILVSVLAPIATNVATEADEGATIFITLTATDPNNETLSYEILSLPAQGTLRDPGNNQDILAGALPYTLSGNGDTVRYTAPAIQGDAVFQWRAIDASGNPSNTANASIQIGQPDYHTELFAVGDPFDLHNRKITFRPDFTLDYYDSCIEPITALPTDPAGGTPLALTDDSSAAVAVATTYFGQSYTQFFVGSNGFITYNAGATGFTESLATHFGAPPRISGLFDDLNPAAGGQVSWRLLPDRVAVTWLNVTEFGATNQNTFQIELHFDETITISHLNVASVDSIVGLSRGTGLPADFVEKDFSAAGACGPDAFHSSHLASMAVLTDIQLEAMANSGGQLEYHIVSLPTHGDLSDPNGGAITMQDYVLMANGSVVEYQGDPGYRGPDSFEFLVMENGVPSDLATVSIDVGSTLITVTPMEDMAAVGAVGGPYFGDTVYTIRNDRAEQVMVRVTRDEPWISLNGGAGPIDFTLNNLGDEFQVTVSVNSVANAFIDGTYEGTVTFTNLTTGGGTTSRDVEVEIGGPVPQHVFNMDTNPGWSYGIGWEYGVPLGGGSGTTLQPGSDPTSGFTGANVIGYNLAGNYSASTPRRNMVTRYPDGQGGFIGLDCSNLHTVELHFMRWLGVESRTWDSAQIEVSNDGVNYTVIWTNPFGINIVDDSWVPQVFDISAIADHQPNVYIRFVMGATDGTQQLFGWNIDDLEIWGIADTTMGGACCYNGACSDVASAAACDAQRFVCDVATNVLPDCGGVCGTTCYADANGDGFVTAADRGFISASIGLTGNAHMCQYDMDGNGFINAADRGFVAASIGRCDPIPDWQNGSGMNHGNPDQRFGTPEFFPGQSCGVVSCD
jgi:subtilisin family serine protease